MRDYSECSASCGDSGVRHQLSKCERISDETFLDDEFCLYVPKPISVEPCNRKECVKFSYKWKVTTEWSKCSATCGLSGTQYQLFYCVKEFDDGKTEEVDERFCTDMRSPKEPRPCNRKPCVEYKWEVTDNWLPCNESCGEYGLQSKRITCKRVQGGKITAAGVWFCAGKDKLVESKPCNRRQCFSFRWFAENNWSECSRTCGDGLRERSVVCKNVTYDERETEILSSFCDESTKPTETEKCSKAPCEVYYLSPTQNWSQCSESCGDSGTQRQNHICKSRKTNAPVEGSYCKDIDVEIIERPCNRRPCFSYEWKPSEDWYPSCQQTCSDAFVEHQTQEVLCKQIFINGEENVAEASRCQNLEKPVNIRACVKLECKKFRWNRADVWSECEAPCGETGIQRLVTECVSFDGVNIETVDDEKCEKEDKPTDLTRFCSSAACYRYFCHASFHSLSDR